MMARLEKRTFVAIILVAVVAATAGFFIGSFFAKESEIKKFVRSDAEQDALLVIVSVMYARLLREQKLEELQKNYDRDLQCASDNLQLRLVRDANSDSELIESAISVAKQYSKEYEIGGCEGDG